MQQNLHTEIFGVHVAIAQQECVFSGRELLRFLAQTLREFDQSKQVAASTDSIIRSTSPKEWLAVAKLLKLDENYPSSCLELNVGGRSISVELHNNRACYDLEAVHQKRLTHQDFYPALKEYYDDALDSRLIVKECRNILAGNNLSSAHAKILPVMLATFFATEVSRNRVSLVTSMMLFDLIENAVSTPNNPESFYSLENFFNHPAINGIPLGELITTPGNFKLGFLGGYHPMAHIGSWEHECKDEEVYNHHFDLTLAHIKSIIILIQWLTKLQHPSFQEIKITTLDRQNYNMRNIYEQEHELALRKSTILKTHLLPLINERLSGFQCMPSMALKEDLRYAK